MHLRSTFPKSHKQSLETSPTFRKQIIRIYNFYNWIYVRRNSEPTNASIKEEKIPLTSVFRPRFRRSAIGISAIEAEIMVKRMVRLEIGILESPRYRISACYLVAFFRGNSPLAIAATCVTKRNNDPISHCKAGLLIDRSIDRSDVYLWSTIELHTTEESRRDECCRLAGVVFASFSWGKNRSLSATYLGGLSITLSPMFWSRYVP